MSKALHQSKMVAEKEIKAKAKALERLYQPAGVNELMPKYLRPDQPKNAKALDIAVVGIPNAGKSTLVNRLVGKKISIVSPKVQTTRKQIQAVLTTADTQLVKTFSPPTHQAPFLLLASLIHYRGFPSLFLV